MVSQKRAFSPLALIVILFLIVVVIFSLIDMKIKGSFTGQVVSDENSIYIPSTSYEISRALGLGDIVLPGELSIGQAIMTMSFAKDNFDLSRKYILSITNAGISPSMTIDSLSTNPELLSRFVVVSSSVRNSVVVAPVTVQTEEQRLAYERYLEQQKILEQQRLEQANKIEVLPPVLETPSTVVNVPLTNYQETLKLVDEISAEIDKPVSPSSTIDSLGIEITPEMKNAGITPTSTILDLSSKQRGVLSSNVNIEVKDKTTATSSNEVKKSNSNTMISGDGKTTNPSVSQPKVETKIITDDITAKLNSLTFTQKISYAFSTLFNKLFDFGGNGGKVGGAGNDEKGDTPTETTEEIQKCQGPTDKKGGKPESSKSYPTLEGCNAALKELSSSTTTTPGVKGIVCIPKSPPCEPKTYVYYNVLGDCKCSPSTGSCAFSYQTVTYETCFGTGLDGYSSPSGGTSTTSQSKCEKSEGPIKFTYPGTLNFELPEVSSNGQPSVTDPNKIKEEAMKILNQPGANSDNVNSVAISKFPGFKCDNPCKQDMKLDYGQIKDLSCRGPNTHSNNKWSYSCTYNIDISATAICKR